MFAPSSTVSSAESTGHRITFEAGLEAFCRTPVWGDSVGFDPAAKIHKTTIEDELCALQQDGHPIDQVVLRAGRSALQP